MKICKIVALSLIAISAFVVFKLVQEAQKSCPEANEPTH